MCVQWKITPLALEIFFILLYFEIISQPAAYFQTLLKDVDNFIPRTLMSVVTCVQSCQHTLFSQRDLRVVCSEAGEVLLVTGDQSQQHDVSRGQKGQRVMRISTLSEERAQKH